jgi:hypothetical protein
VKNDSFTELSPDERSPGFGHFVDQSVSKNGAGCGDPPNNVENIVNNLDLIHWIVDHLLAILVINR